jgi:tetratricopeptide (TPR) repeat protein
MVLAADFDEARALFRSGQYAEVAARAQKELNDQPYSEKWSFLLAQSFWTVGRYADARAVVTNLLGQDSRSIRLRWLARVVFASHGDPARGKQMLQEIADLVARSPWSYREPADVVVYGRALLAAGVEPRLVLDRLFEAVKKAHPDEREVYLAIGDLALEKRDFPLAARTFQEGLAKTPADADLHYGLARSYLLNETPLIMAALTSALKHNSNHLGALLLLADHALSAENYAQAEHWLDRVRAVNPWHPEAWAYEAVMAHLRNQAEREQAARDKALQFWPNNPRVPQLIGSKLSLKYRFAEGAEQQRLALRFDRHYLPAKEQLAQDLLRLGEEDEGWRLAQEVRDQDAYNVTALNLVTLRDTMTRFQTLTNDHFLVRMTPLEARLYGPQVLELLEQARARLGPKYGVAVAAPTRVEVFAEQKDFAVRTFGLPEDHGFLGVCFGRVITANGPAARPGRPFNWQAMLWHEFAHVVTLQLTRNRLPRWLSEGVSVYEERQASPAWGEQITPAYREMILGQELTPIAHLSEAFLAPRSPRHLQFAYHQSSLVVQFVVEQFGFDRLVAILRDLGAGTELNAALAKHTLPLAELEQRFAAYAQQTARNFGPGLDWEKPPPALAGDAASADTLRWAKLHPTNYWLLTQRAQTLVEARHWAEAKPLLEQLVALCPQSQGADSLWSLLAATHRALHETNDERRVLSRWVELDDTAVEACRRLMELAAEAQDWPAVVQSARRYLAINPLVAVPYRFLAAAAAETAETPTAIAAGRALLELDPPNPAEVHFQLARQLHRAGEPAARRHLLLALEEAPRHRDALQLLLQFSR